MKQYDVSVHVYTATHANFTVRVMAESEDDANDRVLDFADSGDGESVWVQAICENDWHGAEGPVFSVNDTTEVNAESDDEDFDYELDDTADEDDDDDATDIDADPSDPSAPPSTTTVS